TGTGEMLTTNSENTSTEAPTNAELVKYFQQKELTKKINDNLLKLEKEDPSALAEINGIIELKLKLKGIIPDIEVA
ncbi:MAG: hypothetical protein ABIJ12_13030, partial [bacterium]